MLGRRLHRLSFIATAGLVVLLGLAQTTPRAARADSWCWDDPTVQVNSTIATINVGLQGTAAEITSSVWSVEIKVHVPGSGKAKVLKTTHQYFTETVKFVPADGASDAGTVEVMFDVDRKNAPKQAGVQVTVNGQTTTTYGRTRQGLKAHFPVD